MNGICDTYCSGCCYLAKETPVCCDYIEITGQRRPCPAGRGCAVRRRTSSRPDARLVTQERLIREQERLEKRREQEAEADRLIRQQIEAEIQFEQSQPQGDIIRAFRSIRHLTQAALGELLNVSGVTISRWENNEVPANWAKLEKVGCKKTPGGVLRYADGI